MLFLIAGSKLLWIGRLVRPCAPCDDCCGFTRGELACHAVLHRRLKPATAIRPFALGFSILREEPQHWGADRQNGVELVAAGDDQLNDALAGL